MLLLQLLLLRMPIQVMGVINIRNEVKSAQ